MEVDVDRVETDEEVGEGVLLGLWDVAEESLLDGVARREGSKSGEVQLEGLGVDIADVNTTLVGEEDVVALTL